MDASFDRLNFTVPPSRACRSYKPIILRVPWMLLVALFAGGLIGLLEYASRELPHGGKGRYETVDKILARSLNERQAASSTTVAAAPSTAGFAIAATNSGAGGSTVAIASSSSPSAANYAPQSNYVSIKASSTLGVIDSLTAGSSRYVDTVTSTAADEASISAASSSYVSIPVAASAPSSDYVPARVSWREITTSYTQMTNATSSIVTTDSRGSATTVTTIVPGTTVVPGVERILFDASHDGRVVTITWPLWKVFVGNDLPVLTAIIFRVFWTAIYNKIKLIEPFTHLARTEGAVAANTLHAYYLSSNLTPDPIKSFFRGHWMIFWASIVYAVTAVIPSPSTEAIFLDTNYQCENPVLTSPNPCWPPRLSVDPAVVRWLQGLLGCIAFMTLGLMLMLARSPTGISHDPSSIASVAALVHHPAVLEDFRAFRDEAQLPEMRALLGDKRYKLDDYRRSDGTWRYGIVPLDSPIDYGWSDKQYAHIKTGHSSGSKQRMRIDTCWDTLFLLFLLGVLGVLAAYFKIGGNNGFNNFLNSNTFGPRFLMATLATIISMNWKRIEREVHTLTPNYELSRSPAPADSTILFRKRSLPYTALFGMLYHKHIFAACLAFTAILADILVITLAGVPYSPGQIWMEPIVCSYMSMAVLGVMIIAVITLLAWRRKSPDLPRAPDTLMSVISYVVDSNMLEDFQGVEGMGKKEMDDRINGLGKRYGYGRSLGVEGQKRFMVDEEFRLVV